LTAVDAAMVLLRVGPRAAWNPGAKLTPWSPSCSRCLPWRNQAPWVAFEQATMHRFARPALRDLQDTRRLDSFSLGSPTSRFCRPVNSYDAYPAGPRLRAIHGRLPLPHPREGFASLCPEHSSSKYSSAFVAAILQWLLHGVCAPRCDSPLAVSDPLHCDI
jgi:hypothetical protein